MEQKSRPLQILGIETSCDECSVAWLNVRREPLLSFETQRVATFSQTELHRPYGGVVPEIASRNHLESINQMIDEATAGQQLADLDAIAVTNRPGLIGSLLVGVSAAKALAYALKKPLIAVNHLEGHASSLFLDNDHLQTLRFPLLLAMISGGHTQLHCIAQSPDQWNEKILHDSLVGRSLDDAAGEAFDKTAKLLGFDYPGGPALDLCAQKGNDRAFDFPRAVPQKDRLDYSFSGLKTAVALKVAGLSEKELEKSRADLSASVQAAIVDALWGKMQLAIKKFNCQSLAIVGGVAANSRLRSLLQSQSPVPVFLPHSKYCTDNAAMIAAAGAWHFMRGQYLSNQDMLHLSAFASGHQVTS